MMHFDFFNVEQELARVGMSPAMLAFRLLDDRYKDILNDWLNLDGDPKGGAERMLALRTYHNYLNAKLKEKRLHTDEEITYAKGITEKLGPFIRQHHVDRMQIEVLQLPLSLSMALELMKAEKVEPFDGYQDMLQRVAGFNRLLFVARDPFKKDGILIDVQVALVDKVSSNITSVKMGLDGHGVSRPTTAIFYAISNADKVSGIAELFLNRVAATIVQHAPSVEFYSTLSPMPGFASWVTGGKGLDQGIYEHANGLLGLRQPVISLQQFGDTVEAMPKNGLDAIDPGFFPVLSRVAALYVVSGQKDARGRFRYTNSVANFHLPNGAEVGRIIIGGDITPKGLSQAASMMVNYFYDLEHLKIKAQRNRAGDPCLSDEVSRVLTPSTRIINAPRADMQANRGVVYHI